jgi:hypothetical protein
MYTMHRSMRIEKMAQVNTEEVEVAQPFVEYCNNIQCSISEMEISNNDY